MNFDKAKNSGNFTSAKLISTFTNTIKQVEKKRGAVYLTKNGYDDRVVMSIQPFEQFKDKQE